MCGIWQIIKNLNISKTELTNYLSLFNSLQSRGPDKTTLNNINNIASGFHRLAINDLSPLGDQPFIWFENNQLITLLCNGEIYNYKELIAKYNITPKSNSDCEIIYHLFKLFNDINKVVLELRGEFVFILNIIMNNNSTSYICRDPFGVRPLFYNFNLYDNIYIFSSLLSGVNLKNNISHVFPPGYILKVTPFEECTLTWTKYYNYNYPIHKVTNNNLFLEITTHLIHAVKIRLNSDRPIGALLSGGLDSSLVCAIASKILGVNNLNTFSIGLSYQNNKKATDIEYANKVAKHINSNHTNILFTSEEGLQAIDDVLKTTESWDITTIRASVGQYLLGKYISENTDIKVLLNGDGADEVEMGYLYFYLAPNCNAAQEETIKLLKEIHLYDGLRVDRCISTHGLEARVPFLDVDFVDYYMNIDPELKIPTKQRMEKQLIRDAFNSLYPDLLPFEVMYRKKEAFSDGISSKEKSWFEIINDWIDTKITDKEYLERCPIQFGDCKTKESYYYKLSFINIFHSTNVIPHYWLPNWINTNGEPSARVLQVYK
jgi:asparagine synthase (glutamine-hydrolysing)